MSLRTSVALTLCTALCLGIGVAACGSSSNDGSDDEGPVRIGGQDSSTGSQDAGDQSGREETDGRSGVVDRRDTNSTEQVPDSGGSGTEDANSSTRDGANTSDGGSTTDGASACLPTCNAPEDCVSSGGATSAEHWKCTDGVCRADFCSEDADCTAYLSGWTQNQGCSVGDCEGVYTCISHRGETYCALEDNEHVTCPSTYEVATFEKADGSGSVPICYRTGTCVDDRYCATEDVDYSGCDRQSDCPHGASCDEEKGVCVCTAGDCADGYKCSSF